MNRGDVKLMIDRLICLDLSEADAEIAESVIARLESFGNEYAALSKENEIGKQMCGRLMAELGEKNDQIALLMKYLFQMQEAAKELKK